MVRAVTGPIVFTVLGAVFAAGLVASEGYSDGLRRIAKPAASLCFIATALAAGALDSAYGTWVLAALVLSAIGDVALLGTSTPSFLGGLVSFLLGHVAYIVAFTVRGLDYAWAAAGVAVLVIPFVVVMRWLIPHAGDLRGPITAYAVVITVMVATAVGTTGLNTDGRILVAAVGFYVSDLAVARDRFVVAGPANRLWGLPLYYAAQFLFAWTVVH